jgi:hypothetical protein
MNKLGWTSLYLVAVALVLGVGTAMAQNQAPDFNYGVGYFTNANASGAPSAQLRLTNDGLFPIVVATGEGSVLPQSLCAAIYVFDTAEEMQECCSCEITPDGYLDLSVNTNLINNILDHGTKPTRGIIKVLSTFFPPSGVCNPTDTELQPGLKGWLTHVSEGGNRGNVQPHRHASNRCGSLPGGVQCQSPGNLQLCAVTGHWHWRVLLR